MGLCPFQMSDHVLNRFKFCHKSVLMLHTDVSPDIYWRILNMNWQAHLEQCHRNPDNLKEPGTMLNLSHDLPHIQRKAHFCKLKTARTKEKFNHQEKYTALHKDKPLHVNLFTFALLDDFNFELVHYVIHFFSLKLCFGDKKR